MIITLSRCLYCKLTTPLIALILMLIRNLLTHQKPTDNSYHTDDQLTFPGYNVIRADSPNNVKRGVCIYLRDSLPVKVMNLNILNECFVCELSFGSQRVCLVSIYRTSSQSSNEYETF